MKKLLACFLTMCTILVSMSMPVFAAETGVTTNVRTEKPTVKIVNNEIGIASARNIDYWNTHGATAISNTTINVRPGAGENLKIHLYLYSNNSITIQVAPAGGSFRTVTTWNSTGHHWADLVSGTNGGTYSVRFIGSTVADGGIYSE